MMPPAISTDFLSGGDLAGYLTYSVIKEREAKHQKHCHDRDQNLRRRNDHDNHPRPSNEIRDNDIGRGNPGYEEGDHHLRHHHNHGLMMSELSDGIVFSTQNLEQGAREFADRWCGKAISFPTLTDAEKATSLGVTLTFVQSMFRSLSSHVLNQREQRDHDN